jgi:hypothetical protein
MYKYYESGDELVQAAWFKYKFNGWIYSSFMISDRMYLMILRASASTVDNWILSTGMWDDDKLWNDGSYWVDSEESLETSYNFEYIDMSPNKHDRTDFLDNGDTIYGTEINLGEWVVAVNGQKDIRASVKFKTIQVSSEEDSEFELVIRDVSRNDERRVLSKYTVDRKPMVYGDTKNTRVTIENNSGNGFRINTISYEGNLNNRSRRI